MTISHLCLHVRMAEWSKAPDSRSCSFSPRVTESVLVHWCGRGFESHFWHTFVFLWLTKNDKKWKKLSASAGNRTPINCLEGNYANHYTTDAYGSLAVKNLINVDNVPTKFDKSASAGNRTPINCLEGNYADHYTTDASCWPWNTSFVSFKPVLFHLHSAVVKDYWKKRFFINSAVKTNQPAKTTIMNGWLYKWDISEVYFNKKIIFFIFFIPSLWA